MLINPSGGDSKGEAVSSGVEVPVNQQPPVADIPGGVEGSNNSNEVSAPNPDGLTSATGLPIPDGVPVGVDNPMGTKKPFPDPLPSPDALPKPVTPPDQAEVVASSAEEPLDDPLGEQALQADPLTGEGDAVPQAPEIGGATEETSADLASMVRGGDHDALEAAIADPNVTGATATPPAEPAQTDPNAVPSEQPAEPPASPLPAEPAPPAGTPVPEPVVAEPLQADNPQISSDHDTAPETGVGMGDEELRRERDEVVDRMSKLHQERTGAHHRVAEIDRKLEELFKQYAAIMQGPETGGGE